MPDSSNEDSAPIQLLELVWGNAQAATPHSWARFNAAMHKALWLAVEGGMRFEKDDFLTLSERFKICLLYTSPSPRDQRGSRMPSSA